MLVAEGVHLSIFCIYKTYDFVMMNLLISLKILTNNCAKHSTFIFFHGNRHLSSEERRFI